MLLLYWWYQWITLTFKSPHPTWPWTGMPALSCLAVTLAVPFHQTPGRHHTITAKPFSVKMGQWTKEDMIHGADRMCLDAIDGDNDYLGLDRRECQLNLYIAAVFWKPINMQMRPTWWIQEPTVWLLTCYCCNVVPQLDYAPRWGNCSFVITVNHRELQVKRTKSKREPSATLLRSCTYLLATDSSNQASPATSPGGATQTWTQGSIRWVLCVRL